MNSSDKGHPQLLRRLRWLTGFFIFGLVVSGATAIPLETEVDWLARLFGVTDGGTTPPSTVAEWLARVCTALRAINQRWPFIGYGGDWLAFGHFAIALAFMGAWRDPVRNKWLFDFGLMACALVVPYALVCGAARGIPLWWRLIDCSFGIIGAAPLWFCRRWTAEMETAPPASV